VLTDLEMPEMDGFTLDPQYQAGRALQGYSGDHSLVTDWHGQRRTCASVGADAYIAKFVAEELGATIRQVLAR
jgi:two-component system chemotaxis response regulator CheV